MEEEERCQGEEASAVASPPSPTVYTVDEDDPQVVPVHLPSASEPLKMELGEEKPAWQSFDQPAMSVGSSPSGCGVVPRSGEEVHGGAGEEETFNAEIVCPHGNLRIGERCKQLVTREVWHTVSSYFHNPKRFLFGKKPCAQCKDEAGLAFIQREKSKEEAARQKSKLPDLFAHYDRPKWSKPSTKRVYLLSNEFVMAWRCSVRGLSAGKADP